MKRSKGSVIIITLMLLTFIGQAFASASISCNHDMAMEPESSVASNSNMPNTTDHTRMMLDSEESANSQSMLMDCCQEECKCPMSGCVSVSLLFSHVHFNAGVITQQKIVQLPLVLQSQINTSLYRPPIS